jgi:head-tail adaptor
LPAWTDLATVAASRSDASAGEGYRAQEVGASISARFLVRYNPLTASVTPRDVLVHDGEVFNITGVREPVGTRNAWIEIDCVARADR